MFELTFLDWNPEKEKFTQTLAEIFSEYVIDAERTANSYDYVVAAMRRWYMSLPKYTKELKRTANGERVDKRYTSFIRMLKQNMGGHAFLFEKLPDVFGYSAKFNLGLTENVSATKNYFDNALQELKQVLIQRVKEIYSAPCSQEN